MQPDGRLGVPQSSEVAGFYEDGIKPGKPGNALIAGHVDDYKGPGIFYPLKKVKPGSFVLLFDAKNDVLVYRVEQNESYVTQDAPLDRLFGDTNEYRRISLRVRASIIGRKKSTSSALLSIHNWFNSWNTERKGEPNASTSASIQNFCIVHGLPCLYVFTCTGFSCKAPTCRRVQRRNRTIFKRVI
ncbi:class F sortase [Paenibacillus silvae]|uniref:class F sortase n=1 Tax=Paenibacillus silvae TaxID=1325358 RepID=UPI00338DD2F8